jgi:hypothetical protein
LKEELRSDANTLLKAKGFRRTGLNAKKVHTSFQIKNPLNVQVLFCFL